MTLSPEERAELAQLEAEIEQHAAAFYAVARALLIIRDKRLYRDEFHSFDDYLTARHKKLTRQRVSQLIDYVGVADNLATSGLQVPNERVARELAPLPATDQTLAFRLAEATAPNGQVTGQWMKSTIAVYQEAQATGGMVDPGDGEPVAIAAAITQHQYETMQRQRQHIRENLERREGVNNSVKLTGEAVVEAVLVESDRVLLCCPALAQAITEGQTLFIVAYVKEALNHD